MQINKEEKKLATGKKDLSMPRFIGESEQEMGDWLTKSLSKYISKMNGLGRGNLYDLVIQGVEKPLIGIVLDATQGNQVQAAELLGINRNTLRKKIKSLSIKINKNGK